MAKSIQTRITTTTRRKQGGVTSLDMNKNVDDSYPCVRCGCPTTCDNDEYLIPNVGMVCSGCITHADLDAWHAHNKIYNPDSYDGGKA